MRVINVFLLWIIIISLIHLVSLGILTHNFIITKLYMMNDLKIVWSDIFSSEEEVYVGGENLYDIAWDIEVYENRVITVGLISYRPFCMGVCSNALIAAYDLNGTLLWRHIFVKPGVFSEFRNVKVYDDRVYAIGTMNSTAVIYVYDLDGNLLYTIDIPYIGKNYTERGYRLLLWNNSIYAITEFKLVKMDLYGKVEWMLNHRRLVCICDGRVYSVYVIKNNVILERLEEGGKVIPVANISLNGWIHNHGNEHIYVDVYDTCGHKDRLYALLRVDIFKPLIDRSYILLLIYNLSSGNYRFIEYSFSGRDSGNRMTITNDAIYISGFTFIKKYRKFLLFKVDLNGNLKWFWTSNIVNPRQRIGSFIGGVDVKGDKIYATGYVTEMFELDNVLVMCLKEREHNSGTVFLNFIKYVVAPFIARFIMLIPFNFIMLISITLLGIAHEDYKQKRWRELFFSISIALVTIFIAIFLSRPIFGDYLILYYK